jgi:drug/metabolite transporter (DMT)-like permease
MENDPRLEELRNIFLSAPESTTTRVMAAMLSLALFAVVLGLVRRRVLREEYTPIWLLVAFGIALLSLINPLLVWLTRSLGAWTPSSTIFFLGQIFLVAICLNYAVRLSGLVLQVKNLGQEVAMLRAQLDAREPRGDGAPRPPD